MANNFKSNKMFTSFTHQIAALFILAIPVACIAWTITHEQIFLETRNYCHKKSVESTSLFQRKFFYLFTCEYCFSHYVAIFILILTQYKLFLNDWRGYVIAGFSLVWIANVYMSVFGYLRQSLKAERIEANLKDNEWHEVKEQMENKN